MSKYITIYTQAYNVEAYIEQCIISVISQTYQNFEWLLIENGSTDKTRDIIKKYVQQDSRIKVEYFEENQRGFANDYIGEKALGDYIVKLDSDDYIASDYLEMLMKNIEKNNADLVMCDAWFFGENIEGRRMRGDSENFVVRIADLRDKFPLLANGINVYWGKLMEKNKFIEADRLLTRYFAEKNSIAPLYGGDTLFMHSYLSLCDKIAVTNSVGYYYRIHKKSSGNRCMDLKRIDDFVILLNEYKDFLNRFGAWTEKNIQIAYFSFWQNIDVLLKSVIQDDGLEICNKIEQVQKIFTNVKVYEIRKEYISEQIRNVIIKHVAWCFTNLQDECQCYFRDILKIVEPDLWEKFSDVQYKYLLEHREVLALFILGEYTEGCKQLMKNKNSVGNEIIDIYVNTAK